MYEILPKFMMQNFEVMSDMSCAQNLYFISKFVINKVAIILIDIDDYKSM
jgi:hypothetical protein